MAVRALVQRPRQSRRAPARPKPPAQVPRHVRGGEQLQGEFRTLPVQHQILCERLAGDAPAQSPRPADRSPAGAAERGRAAAPAATRSRVAASLQCKSSSTSTSVRSVVSTSRASASSRSMRSRVAPSTRRCTASRASARGGPASGPARSAPAAPARPELCPVRPAPEPPQRLQDRQVGFAGAIVLHALPPGHPQAPVPGHLRQKGVHQRRLADAGLARHEAHLAHAAPHLRQPLVELRDLGLPPNGPGRRERRGGGDAARAGNGIVVGRPPRQR